VILTVTAITAAVPRWLGALQALVQALSQLEGVRI